MSGQVGDWIAEMIDCQETLLQIALRTKSSLLCGDARAAAAAVGHAIDALELVGQRLEHDGFEPPEVEWSSRYDPDAVNLSEVIDRREAKRGNR